MLKTYLHTKTTQRRLCHLSPASLMALLKTTPDITDQVLLQFIDVMKLVDLLLHFSLSFVIQRVVGCKRCGEMKAGLVSVVPGG